MSKTSYSSPPNVCNTNALVLFSGGQDSAVCLAWALNRYDNVETIGFDYGQRHAIELSCRPTVLNEIRTHFPNWAPKLGDDHVLDASVISKLGDTALTQDAEIAFDETGLPNTFVPGRNLLFFTLAAAIAYRRSITDLIGGMCETDYSGYPDCRDATLKTLQDAITRGMGHNFTIQTPLMWIDKAQTFSMARDLGGMPLVNLIIEHTHTCYLGDRTHRHEWGYGCGTCPACELRATGYANFV